ncbi:MAG: protein BatD, partial [Elusimicrobia bacterium]|nr:protein BatD [Elusimicrobiota bacterium]
MRLLPRAAALAALAALAAAPARAAVTVTAEASPTRVARDGQITLSVTVSGDTSSLPQPQMPEMPDFAVYSSGSSQSLNWINGQVSASVVYTYVLSPRKEGRLRIPPIPAGGASSAPIEIEVLKADAAPAAPAAASGPPSAPAPSARAEGRGVFVKAFLDKTRAYVNQQVTLTVRFYSAVPLAGDSQYSPPALTGFLSEDLAPVRTGAQTIGGREYKYSEIKTALFPVQPGTLVIGPATVNCQVQDLQGADPFSPDFFNRFFSMGASRPVSVRSEPLTLKVEPLPPGAPKGFTGVVGRLTAKASADRTSVKAGEAVNLTVTVSGTGDVKSVPQPARPDLPSLRFFDTESSASAAKSGDEIGGTKTFRTVVVPRVSGEIRIPPFSFPYYDPARRAYETAATAPIDLRVAPGAPGAA